MQFNGEIEGVPVSATKMLVVTGVRLIRRVEYPDYTLRLAYDMKEESWVTQGSTTKDYSAYEDQLTLIDPLINEMKKVKP